MKSIYELNFHETLKVDCEIVNSAHSETYFVTRVANGWLYRIVGGETTFVPYDDEYNPSVS